MKKTILSFLMLVTLSTAVNAQNVNIPDANFKAFLLGNPGINTNGDTEIQVSEANGYFGFIDCSNQSISDMTGIEAFTSISELICNDNSITSLDLSNSPYLVRVHCEDNFLASLDVSSSLGLMELYCNNNSLSSIDVSNNSGLTLLYCQSNFLTSLDVTNNADLEWLYCFANTISSLDVSNITGLKWLICQTNSLSSLDVSNNTSLTNLNCSLNSLTSLNAANGNNLNFTDFNAKNNPNLTCIQVDNLGYSTSNWTDIDATASFSLNCGGGVGINEASLSSLNTYPNPVQNELFIELVEGQISELEVLDNSGRVVISIRKNNLNSIDVSGLKQGVYTLKVSNEEGVAAKRFVKQ